MGRLTNQKVERLRVALKLLTDYDSSVNEDEVDALCDLALQSLSQEAVRDEAYASGLRYALDVVLDTDEQSECGDELTMIADAIREELALKREPNAAVRAEQPLTKWPSQEGHTEAAGPAPAASWIAVSKRLPKKNVTVLFYCDDGVTEKGMLTIEGWIADDDVDGSPTIGVTHWMPLPPAPGASDE